MSIRYLVLSVSILLTSQTAFAADYYVAADGSDSGKGTSDSPWKTIGHGIDQMASGDALIVRAGIYAGKENFINTRLHEVPDGSAGNFTVIRAETPMAVRINNSGRLTYPDELLRLEGQYVEVDGFIFELKNSTNPPNIGAIRGDYNKVRRSIFRREGLVDTYGGWLHVGGSYNLVEDVAGVGVARYGFGSGGSNAATSKGAFNIWRRVVGRFDYTDSREPKATFNHYGNNDGYNTHHHVYQNCISINGNSVDRHGGSSGFKYGGFTSIKNAADDAYVGNIVIDEEMEFSGFWIDGKDHVLEDNIVWGIKKGQYGPVDPDGLWGRSSLESATVTRMTIGGVASPGTPIDDGSGNAVITNSLEDPVQAYLLYPDAGPNASAGATVLNRVGRSGSLYGEPGWDEVTNENLWPWPYEDEIKAVFSEPNDPPSGHTPTSNDTKRGFCADKDQFGKPMTLTRFIWQYLGNEIPSDIGGTGGSTGTGGNSATGGSAGSGGGLNTGGSGGAGNSAGNANPAGPDNTDNGDGGGCSAAAGQPASALSWWLLLLGWAGYRRTRRPVSATQSSKSQR